MKRAPFVVAATGAGLGLLLSYHTRPLSVGSAKAVVLPGSDTTTTTTVPPSTGTGTGTASTVPSSTTPTTASTQRSGTGQDVPYRYGDLQLRVTEKGSQIVSIQIVSDGASDPRSEQINSQALPLLEQEALSAQSASIDGVSGATFTSLAFEQALQSALNQVGR